MNLNKQNELLNNPFKMKELRNTINALGKQKATGYDNICNEFLKLSTERILKIILAFLNLVLT